MKNIDRVWIILGILAIGNTLHDHWSGGVLALLSVAICCGTILLRTKDWD